MFKLKRELQSADAQIKIYQERIKELQGFINNRDKHINAVNSDLKKERDKNDLLLEIMEKINMLAVQSNDSNRKIFMNKIKEITRDVIGG